MDEELYNQRLKSFADFFRGQNTDLLDDLKSQMKECIQTQEFERAAQFRDQIEAIRKVIQFQID